MSTFLVLYYFLDFASSFMLLKVAFLFLRPRIVEYLGFHIVFTQHISLVFCPLNLFEFLKYPPVFSDSDIDSLPCVEISDTMDLLGSCTFCFFRMFGYLSY